MSINRTKNQNLITLLIGISIILVLNVIGNFVFKTFDLTEERRFTLTDSTKEFLIGLDQEIFVKVWLKGDFPSGFERLEAKTKEILREFQNLNPNIRYEFSDPNEGSVDRINKIREELLKDGMRPINLRIEERGETVDKIIYPYVQIYSGKEYTTTSLLTGAGSNVQNDQTLNDAVALLEYQLVNSIKTMEIGEKPIVLFTSGHGEPERVEMGDLISSLSAFYRVGRANLDSITYINEAIDVLVVADPVSEFSEKDKFKIDQYVMRGGRVLWLLDKLQVTVDSIAKHKFYVPVDNPLNLDDLLFSYGVRILPNLVLDLESTKIPLQIGVEDGQAQFDLFQWYYHIAATPTNLHPIVRNLDRINLKFPSSIDTIKTVSNIRKTSLLKSSNYSRVQFNPVRLNFEIVRYDPDKSKFNQGFKNLAMLYEGKFQSHFKDRITQGLKEGLEKLKNPFLEVGVENRMIVVSDGDLAINLVDPKNGSYRPLGFNPYENHVFDNKNFLLNCIDYLIGDGTIVESRTKKYKLRMMDLSRLEEEKSSWQIFNIAYPLVLLIIVGLIFNFIRKRKYTK